MDVREAIFSRRSIREYTSQTVDDETIHHLIEAAIYAPNAVNHQSWIFTVIRDQSVLESISGLAKAHVLTTDLGRDSDLFRSSLTDRDFHIFYHAPVVILISAMEKGPWIVENCSLAAENMMLFARSFGLGTCWIGFAQGYLNTQEGKEQLGLPIAAVPVAPIIVGHPKSIPFDVPRKTPEVRWIG
jgi:nitroreductase